MEIKKNKELYKSPHTEVLELMEEGVICQSGGDGMPNPLDPFTPGGDPLSAPMLF